MADNSLEIRTRVRMAQWQSIIKECKESGIDYHNLHNIITSQEQVYTTFSHSDELKDTKSGWLNSRYICLGNIPLGIYDSKTLDPIKKPHLEIETDPQGGLKCQFDLIDEGFIFFLGNTKHFPNNVTTIYHYLK